MKTIFTSLILVIFLAGLCGCTKDQVYRGVYEGLTTHEELKETPPSSEHKSYDQYKSERKEDLDKE